MYGSAGVILVLLGVVLVVLEVVLDPSGKVSWKGIRFSSHMSSLVLPSELKLKHCRLQNRILRKNLHGFFGGSVALQGS